MILFKPETSVESRLGRSPFRHIFPAQIVWEICTSRLPMFEVPALEPNLFERRFGLETPVFPIGKGWKEAESLNSNYASNIVRSVKTLFRKAAHSGTCCASSSSDSSWHVLTSLSELGRLPHPVFLPSRNVDSYLILSGYGLILMPRMSLRPAHPSISVRQ